MSDVDGDSPPLKPSPWARLRVVFEMIKIEHTLFALPFALMGALLAARGLPPLATLLWIVVAMFGARSAAMAFNRLVDREIDARNPRTQMRALPTGQISVPFVVGFTVAAAALLVFAAAMLNPLALALSPVALLDRRLLLADQAIHRLVARVSGTRALDRAHRRVGRRFAGRSPSRRRFIWARQSSAG